VRVRLREWRERRGLSLRGLAERAGVSFVTVYRIEAGTISPTVAMLEKLAKALEIDLADFFPAKRTRERAPRRRR
jgi:transcriptional regulator with XRE-family HTH domain